MKIIEAQSAVLTNFEVYHHLTTRPLGSRKANKKGPKDFETLKTEVLQYLTTTPSPLAQKPISYTTSSIKDLIEKLHPYDLSKGEMIMVFNLRPGSIAALNTIIEDMEERFDEQQQGDIVAIIAEVLGQFPPDHKLVAENGAP
ncbi:HRDC-like protein [Plectosphaerella plurivora]|uniref:DNA-directed RNA polymerase III subunit RPC9 n=1 Tax=Plectosphaerella plurivora TaxID=936078 RepID=A0A9P9AF75_9PEZI|nr:HRDC-like protein [Plectosphaerella plurivora]